MTLKVWKEAALQGVPVYFYGSSQQVLDLLSARLPELCPGLKIAGAHPSEFRHLSAQEQALAAERIKLSGAKIRLSDLVVSARKSSPTRGASIFRCRCWLWELC
jgi:N-acetylglucosaminyldiphosphoundecaprenol N-acetyl-beta-D-mannosaminyltransferase